MASVVAPGSQPTPSLGPQQHATTHTKKRAADAPLENEQRLSKRFDLLNLDNPNSRLYIPVPGSCDTPTTSHGPQDPVSTPHPLAATIPLQKSAPLRAPRAPRSDDGMQVEDTPHRVYISDLAAEISDIESDEDNPIFLPDIEKHLAKIPRHVLLGGRSQELKASEYNQVVLYNVPASLTVPAELDGVRKAIVEARQRIRDKQASAAREPERVPGMVGESGNYGGSYGGIPQMEDSDAMDID